MKSTVSMCSKMPRPIAGDTEMRHRDAEGLRYWAKLKEHKGERCLHSL